MSGRGAGGPQPLLVSAGKPGRAGLGLASGNNFSRRRSVGAALVALVPGPGVIRAGNIGPTCENSRWALDWSVCV